MSSIETTPAPNSRTPESISEDHALPFAREASYTPLRMSSVLAVTDLCTLTLSFAVGFEAWSLVNPHIPPMSRAMLLLPVFCVVEFAWSGQYPGIGMTAVEHLRRLWRGITFICLLLTAAMFLTKNLVGDSRGALTLAWLFSLGVAPVGRWLARQFLQSRSWWGVPVVLLGAGETARVVIRNLNSNRVLGYRPVACLDDAPGKDDFCEGVPVLGCLLDAAPIAARFGARHAIVADPEMPTEHLIWHLRRCRHIFPKVLLLPNVTNFASLWAEPRDLGGMLALELRHNLLNRWNQIVKRAIDILIATVGLMASAPFLLICALWIRKASPGSALYSQEREGKDGRAFHVLKLRTMYFDSERLLQQHLTADSESRCEWERYCKLKKDPRILPGVGHFLRKTSLDELPQLWNVLKGEMSLVGPRPFPEYHNSRFDPEFRRVRTQVTPGLTGLWQISARSNGDLQVQQTLDSYYIRNWSLWLDLYILARTILTVLAREGAY